MAQKESIRLSNDREARSDAYIDQLNAVRALVQCRKVIIGKRREGNSDDVSLSKGN